MDNWAKYLLLIFIIIFIVLLDLLLYFRTDKLIESTQNDLSRLEKVIDKKDESSIEKEAKDLINNWKNRENILSYFIEHEEVEKVSLKIAVIEENSKNEEYNVALEDIAETKYLLEHIQDKYNLTLKNIF